jgi:Na+-transporting NADH:ubiquinone oxidoreductase subunit A
MALHRIKQGLDLPIDGAPVQAVSPGPPIKRVACVADDFPGLKPQVLVEEGQTVRRGEALVADRVIPGVRHTAPGAGQVIAVHRGARRVLQSIVIELSQGECEGAPRDEEHATFSSFPDGSADAWRGDAVRDLLVESGLWTALRTRPFGKVPEPGTNPDAIFVTAIDTNPLAAEPGVVLADCREDFDLGLRLVARLTSGSTYLCVPPGAEFVSGIDAPVSVEEFTGPHPAGTAGVHIHALAPVHRSRTVWHIGYQDVVAVARLCRTGRLDVRRVVSLAGPPLEQPRLVRTRVGASMADLTAGESVQGNVRWISGSVLSGKAALAPAFAYMGRYDTQVSVIREGQGREFMGWAMPGLDRFSVIPLFLSKILPTRRYEFTTDTHGSARAMVPIGLYERVMPMDILPTFLLRSLAAGDVEQAERLGCLELTEEDVALCTFVCPGKTDYGPLLRKTLDIIEREG